MQRPTIGAVYSGDGPALANETTIESIVLQDDDLKCDLETSAYGNPRDPRGTSKGTRGIVAFYWSTSRPGAYRTSIQYLPINNILLIVYQ